VDTRIGREARSPHGHFLHKREASFLVSAFGQDFHLDLELAEGLIHPNYHVIYEEKDGRRRREEGAENCFYRGTVNGQPGSWAALSTCGQALHGLFSLPSLPSPASDPLTLYISPSPSPSPLPHHVVYRKEDVVSAQNNFSCDASQDSLAMEEDLSFLGVLLIDIFLQVPTKT